MSSFFPATLPDLSPIKTPQRYAVSRIASASSPTVDLQRVIRPLVFPDTEHVSNKSRQQAHTAMQETSADKVKQPEAEGKTLSISQMIARSKLLSEPRLCGVLAASLVIGALMAVFCEILCRHSAESCERWRYPVSIGVRMMLAVAVLLMPLSNFHAYTVHQQLSELLSRLE